MSDNYFQKQPSEIFSISVDYELRMADGETIASKTVSAVETKHNSDRTSTVIDSSTINGTSVYVKVKNGTDGVHYKITVKAVTSGGNTLEEDIIMFVSEE